MAVTLPHQTGRQVRWEWILLAVGLLVAAVAVIGAWRPAQQAAAQTWTPFVLVTGLLMVGLAAEDDGLFRAAGQQLAARARPAPVFFGCAAMLIALVTATLNLDTSVVFVTPVLIAAARVRGNGAAPLLYGSLLLANSSSLFLPGSNLTNLIVQGHPAESGGAFLAHMWPAAIAASVVTACVVGFWGRHSFHPAPPSGDTGQPVAVGLGALAVALTIIFVLVLRSPAVPVLVLGLAVSLVRVAQRRLAVSRLAGVVDLTVIVGLFGLTMGVGTLARVWHGPATWLAHAGPLGVAVIAAGASVLINNLPAAALLAPGHAPHAAALLVGLNLGPNLFVTGSLAWFLWLRIARASGATPSVRQASRLGMVIVPLSMAAALTALWLA